ncbi:30S ribosome-binding factor RbfA [Gammaproteobacteria bacterium]|nr:30S ribosome-binding factor RbfA [Gammaproteobacteria bacterium]
MTGVSSRAQRVGDQIQKELASLIQLEVSDPRIGMVSITGVEVSRDLSHAKVYVTVMNTLSEDASVNQLTLSSPGELDRIEVEENIRALSKASGFLRTMLSKRLRSRSIPKLQFFYDNSIERGQQLSGLIDNALKADRALSSGSSK